ncbi:MAG: cytochrome c [bacterium]|nr:cytochrome c [bacterium]
MRRLLILSLLLVAGCAPTHPPLGRHPAPLPAPVVVPPGSDPVSRGKALVEARCTTCHAVGPTGESPVSPAPAFRTLGQRYPVANLQEAFAEGISNGHPKMPQFVLEEQDVTDLIAYLESIQTPAKAK